jgi:hypothetical protein
MNFPSKELREILAKAIVDKDFRDLLYADRSAALASYDPTYKPSVEDLEALDQIPQDKIDELGQQSVALAVAVAIVVKSDPPPGQP